MRPASPQDDLVGASPGASFSGPAAIAGIEQEYGVWIDGGAVDFADLIDRVAPRTAVRRVPHDPQARFLASGSVLTVDSPQAEIATPPRPLSPSISGRMADDALAGREYLLRRLRQVRGQGERVELRGYSTHLNAACPGDVGWRVVRRYARTFAPALMLLADRTDSPGLLVRPRPDRLEVGTDFLETRDDLVAATLFFLASTIRTWEDELTDRPPVLALLDDGQAVETWQRPGLFIDRAAFGEDLYRLGRSARLDLADGGSEPAGERLERAWGSVRSIAAGFASPQELAIVDALVSGHRRLLTERGAPIEPTVRRRHRVPPTVPGPHVPLLGRLVTGRVTATPVSITWGSTLLRVAHPARDFFVRIPRESSADFARRFTSGALDASIAEVATGPTTGLAADPYDDRPGVFDAAADPWPAAADRRKSSAPIPPGKARRPKSTVGPRSALTLISPLVGAEASRPAPPAPVARFIAPRRGRRPRTGIVIVALVLLGGLVLLVRAGQPGKLAPHAVLPSCLAGLPGAAAFGCAGAGQSPGTQPLTTLSPSPSCSLASAAGGCAPASPQATTVPSCTPDAAATACARSVASASPGPLPPRATQLPCQSAVGSSTCPTSSPMAGRSPAPRPSPA
ncbi:MAG: hypothetical protein ACHQ01_05780, partial [Candidatus Limnocylindrales bacterium]